MSRFISLAVSGAVLAALCALLVSTPVAARSGFFDFFDRDWAPEFALCLTDYQVRQAIARMGFSNIYLNVGQGDLIEVRASQDGWVYLIDFNRCTGRIKELRALRPA